MHRLAVVIAIVLVQLMQACEPPDCDRQDCGACGNACCNLNFYCDSATQDLYNTLVALLSTTGPDQHYSFVGKDDLRQYNISAQFIIQGIHTTFVHKYNDTLNFVMYPNEGVFRTRLAAFSISQFATAYCDDGQNYKNLILLIKNLGVNCVETAPVFGCPRVP